MVNVSVVKFEDVDAFILKTLEMRGEYNADELAKLLSEKSRGVVRNDKTQI